MREGSSRSGRRSRSRSRGRRSRSSKSRSYQPPNPDYEEIDDVPKDLYVVKNSPDSGLTNERPKGQQSMPRAPTNRPRDYEEASAYRLANNPYHGDVHPVSPRHRENLNKWYQKRFPIVSKSYTDGTRTVDHTLSDGSYTQATYDNSLEADEPSRRVRKAEDDYVRTKQSVAYLSIMLTSVQLLVLMLQLTMCGMAPWEVNGFIGPYPDSFSEWGGKNAYLILYDNQWWRLVTPSFLNVGILHLLINAFCQLEAIAFFEREWGSFRWGLVYIISSVGCNAFSCYFDPDEIAVGSSLDPC